ncbi:MAG: hypothetical protein B6I30_09670 [Desulfobacteraceae bacterium 4572_187]|nr:MAG: hypothetical protein B6I30_09670 [Desulfobacteraceae bacterium 4572_187]
MRIECQISRLETALSNIRKMHPHRGEAVTRIGDTLIDKVRKQLEEISFDNLEELAYRFGIREILACVEIIARERVEETAQKAAGILVLRPRKKALYRVWFKLVPLYPNHLLEKTIKEMISKKGFQGLNEMPEVSPAVTNWLISKRLDEGVLRDHQTRSGQKTLDPYLKENHIIPDDGLHRAAWCVLLKKGSAKLISRETPKRLMEVFEDARNAADSQKFGQHYLNVLQKRPNWAAPILEWIEKKFGVPTQDEGKTSIETPFWRQVEPTAKKEFAIWVMEKRIEQFFEGQRADFWKRFLQAGKVIRVQEILQGDGFMIDFGRFGVIEFKQVGNAAYVYPQSVFSDYWRRSQKYYHPSEFKDTDRTIRNASLASWDGRILHPRNSWQESAAQKIHQLLRNK